MKALQLLLCLILNEQHSILCITLCSAWFSIVHSIVHRPLYSILYSALYIVLLVYRRIHIIMPLLIMKICHCKLIQHCNNLTALQPSEAGVFHQTACTFMSSGFWGYIQDILVFRVLGVSTEQHRLCVEKSGFNPDLRRQTQPLSC